MVDKMTARHRDTNPSYKATCINEDPLEESARLESESSLGVIKGLRLTLSMPFWDIDENGHWCKNTINA